LKEIASENIFKKFSADWIFFCANKKENHDFNKNRGTKE